MQHKCKITVLETKVFPKLQKKYLADSKSGACSCFKVGDTFLLKRTPESSQMDRIEESYFDGLTKAY